jgi:hypothetical protein
MLIPVPIEVMTMLKMFKAQKLPPTEDFSPPSLISMLLPHFEEIFDEIEVKTVVLTAPYKNTDLKMKKEIRVSENIEIVKYVVQGLVSVYEDGKGGKGEFGEASTVAVIEWSSSPLGELESGLESKVGLEVALFILWFMLLQF